MKNIVLCGFMGCGKSTVGTLLAGLTGRPFIDMDSYIEAKQDMVISEIFRRSGEAAFRELEHQACLELAQRSGCIIAAGGGALTFPRNAEALRTGSHIVFLHLPLESVIARLKNDTARPLLDRSDREEFIARLYAERIPLYQKVASITVDADRPPRVVAADILRAVDLQR